MNCDDGPKKLSEIREELRRALTRPGGDPVQWLDDRIRSLQSAGNPSAGATDVLDALRRVLETPAKSKRRRKRAGVKK
jgi:hypothetical protein